MERKPLSSPLSGFFDICNTSSWRRLQIEKLKKQVEKLKSEKESLKREKRSLNGKLATAKAKADKYHDALKKKATPKDGLDRETFGLMMSLLDDISTQR